MLPFIERLLPWLTGAVGFGLLLLGLFRPEQMPHWAGQTAWVSIGLTAALTLARQAKEGALRRGLTAALLLIAVALAAAQSGGRLGHMAAAWAAGRGMAPWAVTLCGLALGSVAGLAVGALARRALSRFAPG